MTAETLAMIMKHHKGDVLRPRGLPVFRQQNGREELIPLCHPLLLSKVEVSLLPNRNTIAFVLKVIAVDRKNRRRNGSIDCGVCSGFDHL